MHSFRPSPTLPREKRLSQQAEIDAANIGQPSNGNGFEHWAVRSLRDPQGTMVWGLSKHSYRRDTRSLDAILVETLAGEALSGQGGNSRRAFRHCLEKGLDPLRGSGGRRTLRPVPRFLHEPLDVSLHRDAARLRLRGKLIGDGHNNSHRAP